MISIEILKLSHRPATLENMDSVQAKLEEAYIGDICLHDCNRNIECKHVPIVWLSINILEGAWLSSATKGQPVYIQFPEDERRICISSSIDGLCKLNLINFSTEILTLDFSLADLSTFAVCAINQILANPPSVPEGLWLEDYWFFRPLADSIMKRQLNL